MSQFKETLAKEAKGAGAPAPPPPPPLCEECQQQPAKYCCPRCSRRTCSLACVSGEPLPHYPPLCRHCRQSVPPAPASSLSPNPPHPPHAAHKEAAGCSGKRDRTAFVGRAAFDERTFMSDYRFLEEVQLAEDVAKRSKPPAPKLDPPQYLQTLVYQARR